MIREEIEAGMATMADMETTVAGTIRKMATGATGRHISRVSRVDIRKELTAIADAAAFSDFNFITTVQVNKKGLGGCPSLFTSIKTSLISICCDENYIRNIAPHINKHRGITKRIFSCGNRDRVTTKAYIVETKFSVFLGFRLFCIA